MSSPNHDDENITKTFSTKDTSPMCHVFNLGLQLSETRTMSESYFYKGSDIWVHYIVLFILVGVPDKRCSGQLQTMLILSSSSSSSMPTQGYSEKASRSERLPRRYCAAFNVCVCVLDTFRFSALNKTHTHRCTQMYRTSILMGGPAKWPLCNVFQTRQYIYIYIFCVFCASSSLPSMLSAP